MNVDWRIKTFSQPIMIAFFMLLGYLEAGLLGALAGLVLYGIAVLSILTALIPFVGAYLWWSDFLFLANNLGSFIGIADLTFKITWIVGVIAIPITVITSILTVLAIYGFVKWYLNRNKKKAIISPNNVIDSIIHLIPSDLIKGFNINNLSDIINKIVVEIQKLWDKLNVKLVGSAAVFTGIGIASHDFHWESEVHESGMSRPTHGAYLGLQIALGGMHTIVSDQPLGTQIKKLVLAYLGVIICYVSFFTMQFIPRGISRIVNHFLWWSGIVLIIYNWYNLMGEDINKVYKLKQMKAVKKIKKP
jgi:hypothetical protein